MVTVIEIMITVNNIRDGSVIYNKETNERRIVSLTSSGAFLKGIYGRRRLKESDLKGFEIIGNINE